MVASSVQLAHTEWPNCSAGTALHCAVSMITKPRSRRAPAWRNSAPADREHMTTKSIGVDPALQRNYDEYYGDDLSEWRGMGAIDKVANIRRLCANLAPSTILDIGAGEGSVLQRLAEDGFGERHFALDISESGVERIG